MTCSRASDRLIPETRRLRRKTHFRVICGARATPSMVLLGPSALQRSDQRTNRQPSWTDPARLARRSSNRRLSEFESVPTRLHVITLASSWLSSRMTAASSHYPTKLVRPLAGWWTGRYRGLMTYRAILAHVYSSRDGYESANPATALPPVRPSGAGRLTVTVGRAPRWLFRASRRLQALDILRGGSFAGWLSGVAPDPQFRLRPGQLSRPWYTTLVFEVPALPVDVTEWDKAMEHEALLLDAAVLIASRSSANVIEKRELGGIFLQRTDGKWVKCPTFSLGTPSVLLHHADAELQADVLGIGEALRGWHFRPASQVGSTRTDWAIRGLLADEPWSRFVWMMFSLERLTQEHYVRMDATSRQRVRRMAERYVRDTVPNASVNWQRPSITMRFATVAADLSPATGASDTSNFHSLGRARNDLLHGATADAPEGATQQAALDLTLRYNALVALHRA